jgi:hypothetical protein
MPVKSRQALQASEAVKTLPLSKLSVSLRHHMR